MHATLATEIYLSAKKKTLATEIYLSAKKKTLATEIYLSAKKKKMKISTAVTLVVMVCCLEVALGYPRYAYRGQPDPKFLEYREKLALAQGKKT